MEKTVITLLLIDH